MSVHPYVHIVYGVEVNNVRERVTRAVTKYDVNTGKPYEKEVDVYEAGHPNWVLKLLEEREKFIDEHNYDRDEYEKQDVAVFPMDDCGEELLIGKLILSFDAMDGESGRIKLPGSIVMDEIKAVLMEYGVKSEDIGIHFGIEWS